MIEDLIYFQFRKVYNLISEKQQFFNIFLQKSGGKLLIIYYLICNSIGITLLYPNQSAHIIDIHNVPTLNKKSQNPKKF